MNRYNEAALSKEETNWVRRRQAHLKKINQEFDQSRGDHGPDLRIIDRLVMVGYRKQVRWEQLKMVAWWIMFSLLLFADSLGVWVVHGEIITLFGDFAVTDETTAALEAWYTGQKKLTPLRKAANNSVAEIHYRAMAAALAAARAWRINKAVGVPESGHVDANSCAQIILDALKSKNPDAAKAAAKIAFEELIDAMMAEGPGWQKPWMGCKGTGPATCGMYVVDNHGRCHICGVDSLALGPRAA